jgi:hypothetical protein
MPDEPVPPVIGNVLSERNQDHRTRKAIFGELEAELGRPIVALFTSFSFPVILEDGDVDIIAGVLQSLDLRNGLALMISSPGGDGLAAERMINVCRSFSGTGEYWVLVPGKAKSAATMVCFGASKILMGPTSELGPVDPQMAVTQEGNTRWFSAYNAIQAYNELFQQAVQTKGNLEPYLQQLSRFDATEIKELQASLDLSEDISISALASGTMKGQSQVDIKKRIKAFLTPETKKTHGRPIYGTEAQECGLPIDILDPGGRLWSLVYELYIRTNDYVSTQTSKCIESKHHSFAVPARQ